MEYGHEWSMGLSLAYGVWSWSSWLKYEFGVSVWSWCLSLGLEFGV